MVDRNFEPDKICNICNAPFKPGSETGGAEVVIGGVTANLCGMCYDGMSVIIAEDEPHVTIDCPKCDHEIGIRIEVIDDP
jgi:hypothetical protein